MHNLLPKFIVNELNLYPESKNTSFQTALESILTPGLSQKEQKKLLYDYLIPKSMEEFSTDNQLLLLATCLLGYWSKDYDMILEFYNKFSGKIQNLPFSLRICFLLTLRDLFMVDEFQTVDTVTEHYIQTIIKSEEDREFLFLALNEFSAQAEHKPELGFKAINQLIRLLQEGADVAFKYPFIFDALQSDLVKYGLVLSDESFRNAWIESAAYRAEQSENDGLLCLLYDLKSSIYSKEYNLAKSKEYIKKGLEIAKKLESKKLEILLYLNIATNEKMVGKLDEAQSIYLEILAMGELSDNMKISVLGKIGEIYLNQEKIDEAYSYYYRAHELNKELGILDPLIEITYGYLQKLKGVDEGESLQEGMHLAEQRFDFNAIPYYYYYKALYEQKKVNLSLAVKDYMKALDFFENQLHFSGIVYTNSALAECYLNMFKVSGETDYSIQFLYYIDNLLNILKELQNPLYIETVKTKANFYRYTNNEQKAEEVIQEGIKFAEEKRMEKGVDQLNSMLKERKPLSIMFKGTEILFKKIRTFSFGDQKSIPTKLYLLLVINEGGIPLLSHNFSDELKTDDMLVSGLISAIINFSSEVLGKGVDTLRSINHEGRTVIIEQAENIMGILVAEDETFENRLDLKMFLKTAVNRIVNKPNGQKHNQEQLMAAINEIFKNNEI